LKSAVKCRRAVISVFLRYPVEYTLTSCPISWDHLNLGGLLMGSVFPKVSQLAACTCVTVN